MNIKKAKQQLKNAVTAYLTRDVYGGLRIPVKNQRPVFLMGPPGIGKTDIVRQVAEELNIGFVSYSITHHTRQSALGLPMIVEKEYDGAPVPVSEYTMSEIIASVHDVIAGADAREGILFLDEVNCASETLTPVMLQFLQFKTFGRHRVPDGWVVVTAGNPPEYNRSAREFDAVTWDRLKRIDIEPDYEAWREYAASAGIHGAVLSYLDIKKDNFYRLETTPEGVRFVTARGWSDLSEMLFLYEENGIAVDADLTSQYLQHPEIAEDFCAYYELYNKYRSDYQVEAILDGTEPEEIVLRAKEAGFDERLSLTGLLLAAMDTGFRRVIGTEDLLTELLPALRAVKAGGSLEEETEKVRQKAERTEKRGVMTRELRTVFSGALEFLDRMAGRDFPAVKEAYDGLVAGMKEDAAAVSARLTHLFSFMKRALGESELLILVTELTAGLCSARFLARYGCEAYDACSEELAFYERHLALIRELDGMEI